MELFHPDSSYHELHLLGKGMSGQVSLVQDTTDGTRYACKTASEPQLRELLRREAALQQKIEHPLFVKFHQLLETQEKTFLIMEYIRGENLYQAKKLGKITEKTAVSTAISLAEGLSYLHHMPQPILYRDLKPEHVILTETGVKLLDLGCACGLSEAYKSRAGTKGYAAPEQLDEEDYRQDTYSDIYSLGRILCFLCEGIKPSPALKQLIAQCTAENPETRIPDMWLVLHILHGLQMTRKSAKALRKRTETFIVQKFICKY